MKEVLRSMTNDNVTFLRKGGIEQRMNCTGNVAHNIESAFVTVEQMMTTIESDSSLTAVDGIGPKTADTIMDWYEHRFEREEVAADTTVTRTSDTSLNISFHSSWNDAIGKNNE